MSNELKSSFSDLTRTEFQAYASDLLEAYPSSAERQRLQAYMLQTIAQDGAAVVADQAALSEKRFRRMEHQEVLEELVLAHAHDYARADSLFQEQTRTDQQIVDLLKADDAEVYIKNRTLSGSNVLLEGDRTKFCGLGATGTAVGGDLACTCVVNGRIVVSGTHATIEGIHFKHAAEWTDDVAEMPLVSFTGSTNVELVFKNCIFENTGSHADGRFWHGEHSGGGTQRIGLIKNFTSWMLLDDGVVRDPGRQARQLRDGRVQDRELHGLDRGARQDARPQRQRLVHQQPSRVRRERAARFVLGLLRGARRDAAHLHGQHRHGRGEDEQPRVLAGLVEIRHPLERHVQEEHDCRLCGLLPVRLQRRLLRAQRLPRGVEPQEHARGNEQRRLRRLLRLPVQRRGAVLRPGERRYVPGAGGFVCGVVELRPRVTRFLAATMPRR